MSQLGEDIDLSHESPCPLLVRENKLKPFAGVLSLTWLMHDLHNFSVCALSKLLYQSEILWQLEISIHLLKAKCYFTHLA